MGLKPEIDTWTIRRIIQWIASDLSTREMNSPRLDAELLVAHALKTDRMRLYLDLDRPLLKDELIEIRALLTRRRKYEPMAYIVGSREFYGRKFEVTPDVLIPRPDTETLVEMALERMKTSEGDAPMEILDLCTGSGAVGITLAAERSACNVTLTDVSQSALDVAERNATTLEVRSRCEFVLSDLFASITPRAYDIITANAPYVPQTDEPTLSRDVREYEPHLALFSGQDGLTLIRRLVVDALPYTRPLGWLLLEVGAGQAPAVAALLTQASWTNITIQKDLGGIERVVMAQRSA